MNLKLYNLISLLGFFVPCLTSAVEFTKEKLELVKDACLAGSSFEIKTEANGSISIKNMQGKGEILVSQKDVTTVDLPDSDKKEEFKEIRACIKDYLTQSPGPEPSTIVLKEWALLVPHDGKTPGVGFSRVRLLTDNANPVELKAIGFADVGDNWGFRYSGTTLQLTPVNHTATFEIDYSINDENQPSKGTASCTTIVNAKQSVELTPEVHAKFDGPDMHIESCTLK